MKPIYRKWTMRRGQQGFTLLRRLLPRRHWTQPEFRCAFTEMQPDVVEIELLA